MTGTKQEYIDYRISKSEEIYSDALLLSENERWNSCVNRLYYSSYYLASALLYANAIKGENSQWSENSIVFKVCKVSCIKQRTRKTLFSSI